MSSMQNFQDIMDNDFTHYSAPKEEANPCHHKEVLWDNKIKLSITVWKRCYGNFLRVLIKADIPCNGINDWHPFSNAHSEDSPCDSIEEIVADNDVIWSLINYIGMDESEMEKYHEEKCGTSSASAYKIRLIKILSMLWD